MIVSFLGFGLFLGAFVVGFREGSAGLANRSGGILTQECGTLVQDFSGRFVVYKFSGELKCVCINRYIYIYIYDPGSRFATTPPPSPPMVWSQNLRFAAFCMKKWYLQCFLHGGWLARSAHLQMRGISCSRPSENVLFAMFRLRHCGVVPLHPPLCRIVI